MQTKIDDILPLESEHLQNLQFILLSDSQEIESVCDHLGKNADDYSGLLVWCEDGDYVEVWATTWSKPYLLACDYTRLY